MRKVKKNNFKQRYPEVAEEWHPTKNGDLGPEHVSIGSGLNVWWKCEMGHEWKTAVYHRSYGSICPYCRGMFSSEDYNLAQVNPELAAQWHPVKNRELTPDQVTPGSERRVWWRCKCGYEWNTAVYNRKKNGCPKCAVANSRGKRQKITLAQKHPHLIDEWHPEKNGELTPETVTYGSNKKVWWRCEVNHEWEMSIKVRSKGQECPYCSGIRPSEQYNLQVVNPELSKQWHPTRNGDLTPTQVTPGSETYIWWICDKGHVWDAMVYERNSGSSCPYCMGRRRSKFVALAPKLKKEWHPTENGDLSPDKIPRDVNLEVWWRCKNRHEWKAGVIDRKHGQRCPFCNKHRKTV